MTSESATRRGQLCIWTGVDPAHDEDFNRWYDREHMQERVAIPGFQSARRFRAIGTATRPYLALFVVPADQASLEILRGELARVREESGIVRAAVLCTDVGLSTPLIANAPPAAADALVTIESTRAEAGLAQARALAVQLGLPTDAVHCFRTMWRLGA